MKPLLTLTISILALSILPFEVNAQANLNPTFFTQDISASISPLIPKANEQVTIDIVSYSYDINAAMVTWYLNGKKQLEGRGQTHFTFKVGNLGDISKIQVNITPQGAASFTKDFIFNPSEINLIWEAQTYTPPFYKGKALFADEADVKVVAMPIFIQNGKMLQKENLIYTWKVGGDILQSKSGYGKYYISFSGGYFGGKERVDVTVSSIDESIQGFANIIISPTPTQIILYENHPLFGILTNNAIELNYQLKNKEVTFIAAPFFFSKNIEGLADINLNWGMNGSPVQSGDGGNMITLRQDSQVSGTSLVDVTARHKSKTFQQSEKKFSVIYNK
jgi:hypothetical protein